MLGSTLECKSIFPTVPQVRLFPKLMYSKCCHSSSGWFHPFVYSASSCVPLKSNCIILIVQKDRGKHLITMWTC
uniref:Uncharacterized protein n=1 Tax=Aegilops tauschii subsp. strangulata TaxID=200361 RepID=A0A453NT48_AEGTS